MQEARSTNAAAFTLEPCTTLPNSTDQGHSWKTNARTASQEIPISYGTWKYILVQSGTQLVSNNNPGRTFQTLPSRSDTILFSSLNITRPTLSFRFTANLLKAFPKCP